MNSLLRPRRIAAAAALAALTAAGADAEVDFNRDVRPILSRHCFKCHGPDDGARQADLRLDLRESAVAEVIRPGKPDDSELIRRIFSKDESEVMPPRHTKRILAEADKQTLRAWIAEGAAYKPHWAFVGPRPAPPPEVRRTGWARTPVDRFILARLEAEGLSPSPEADRLTLARRVYLDLIGLPPTPQEADAFASDPTPDAYEKLVDSLLARPEYGQRWARRWLDLARYADTNGYEKDRLRAIWLWRDWVVDALNADMPFDQFTVEQIAGDMLSGATVAARIATGFHRNTMLNEEGGIDPLEFRFHAVTDRVATTGTVWLGLTLGCAQCHTHKFDPVQHRDYYRLTAFLNNADEPELTVPDAALEARRAEIAGRAAALEAGLAERFPPEPPAGVDDTRDQARRRADHLERRLAAWAADARARAVRWSVLTPLSARSDIPTLTLEPGGVVFVKGDQSKSDVYELRFGADAAGVVALRLEALPDPRLPRNGPGRVSYEGPFGDFFLSEFTLEVGGARRKFAKASSSFSPKDRPASKAIDGDPQSGWTIDGGQGRAHTAVFTLTEPLPAGEFTIKMLFERYYAAGLGRFRISATTDAKAAAAADLPAEIESLLTVPAEALTPEQQQSLRRHFLSIAPELAKARGEIDALRRQMPALPTTLVMAERDPDNTRPTYLHHRGEFLQAKERVAPAVLPFLHKLPAGAPANRLGFARWLVAPDNPLVGRVTVNREWSAFFGKGLVRTTGDFGLTGEPPSHPELLDWLAVEFVRQGWSLKRLHRLIATSAVYRQSGTVSPELLRRDADNRLLARGPRVRLEAEVIRDAALRAAGLLSSKAGGPPVFPPQPAGVSTEGSYRPMEWRTSTGEDRYRRSLYTFARRTQPFALYATFDAPSGEFCTPRRDLSNTPLQALALLNDTVFVEAAQALGRIAASAPGDAPTRATLLFRRVLTRPPAADESAAAVAFVEAQTKRLAADLKRAAALAGPGAGDAVQRAAWTALARALLNLDEAITKE